MDESRPPDGDKHPDHPLAAQEVPTDIHGSSDTTIIGEQRHISTGGGDYAEGNIDKRQGTFITDSQVVIQAPSPLPALHQLRVPVADFVGRAEEIAQLVTTLRQAATQGGVAAICGVQAMGGMGKTELAYVVAQHLTDTYPDAQIVLDLRGVTSDPLTPVQVLQRAITAFDVTMKLPDAVDVLLALYRSLLHGQRVFILADDARDAAQVEHLVPPTGCALLITSRQRFMLRQGMISLNLGRLLEMEAITLLRSLVPTLTNDQAEKFAQLCGYLPLALRIVGGALAKGCMPFLHFLSRLQDERTRLAMMKDHLSNLDVEASLHLSYALLEPSLCDLLCQVAAFPASFDVAAAEGVLQVDEGADLFVLLGELQDYYLLSHDTEKERYDQHALVRLFVRQQAESLHKDLEQKESRRVQLSPKTRTPFSYLCSALYWEIMGWWGRLPWNQLRAQQPLLAATQKRHARYYLTVAQHADRLYLAGGDKMLAGLALFDAERIHIDAGWSWIQERMGHEAADRVILAYAYATIHVGSLRYALRTARMPQLEAALAAARRLKDVPAEGQMLGNLGLVYAALGEVKRAIDHH